jgi:MFS superfamily sulfate permease-like transporter
MNKHPILSGMRSNIFAGFVVSLIAMPLALGLAIASGFPPIAGIIASVVGGVVVAILGGSHVTITGPGNGLVVVLLGAVTVLGEGDMQAGYLYALAAVILSGVLLLLFGFLRFGSLSDFFPATAIQGMLSAIGITILLKQLYVMFGDLETKGSALELFLGVPALITSLFTEGSTGQWYAAGIGVVSLLIMVFYSKIRSRFFHLVPAPMWVVLLALGFDAYFSFVGGGNPISKALLISLPENLLGGGAYTEFFKMDPAGFLGSSRFYYAYFKYRVATEY